MSIYMVRIQVAEYIISWDCEILDMEAWRRYTTAMFIQEDEFFSKARTLMDERTHLDVVVASRRLDDVYDEKLFVRDGLRISILQSVQNAAHIVQCAQCHDNGDETQSEDHVYVLYGSQSECERIRTVVQNIYAMEPASTVIIVVCPCDQELKCRLFADIVEEKKVKHVVMTSECGGTGFMCKLIAILLGSDPRLKRQASAIDSQAL